MSIVAARAVGAMSGPMATSPRTVWLALPLLVATASACGGGAIVSDCFTALDAAGDRRRTEFFTDTENIFCVAKIAAAPTGTTVNAKIRFVEAAGQPQDILLAIGEDVASGAETTSAFQLIKPPDTPDAPWPVGKFACDILLDGVESASVSFDIVMPECPLYAVSNGVSCAGYYPVGAQCPAVVQTQTCTCDSSGSWKC
jgi:hypothetical protein